MPRLGVEFDAFPGGWSAWRRAFKRSAATYYRVHIEPLQAEEDDADPLVAGDDDADPFLAEDDYVAPRMTPGHYAHRQLYYEVKSRVNAAAHRVAQEAGVTHRDLCL